MVDETLRILAGSVVAGELTSAGAMLDRLSELQDRRWHDLAELLGTLIELRQSHIDYDTDEERAFREDNRNYRAWLDFETIFRRLFWVELCGQPPLEALHEAQRRLNTTKQAKRLDRARSAPTDLPSGESYPSDDVGSDFTMPMVEGMMGSTSTMRRRNG